MIRILHGDMKHPVELYLQEIASLGLLNDRNKNNVAFISVTHKAYDALCFCKERMSQV